MGNVVITGGSRGIGAAAVELFAARGDRVTFLYEKNHTAAKAVAEETGATAICCDVADREAVNRAFSQIGDVDILVCNAGTIQEQHHEAQHQHANPLCRVGLHLAEQCGVLCHEQ